MAAVSSAMPAVQMSILSVTARQVTPVQATGLSASPQLSTFSVCSCCLHHPQSLLLLSLGSQLHYSLNNTGLQSLTETRNSESITTWSGFRVSVCPLPGQLSATLPWCGPLRDWLKIWVFGSGTWWSSCSSPGIVMGNAQVKTWASILSPIMVLKSMKANLQYKTLSKLLGKSELRSTKTVSSIQCFSILQIHCITLNHDNCKGKMPYH